MQVGGYYNQNGWFIDTFPDSIRWSNINLVLRTGTWRSDWNPVTVLFFFIGTSRPFGSWASVLSFHGTLFPTPGFRLGDQEGSEVQTGFNDWCLSLIMLQVWFFFFNYLLNSNHSWTPLIVYFWDNESSGTLNKFHRVRGAEVLTQTRSRDVTQDQILIWVEHHKMCRAGYDTGAGIMSGRSQGTVLVKTFHVESFFSFSLTVWMWWHCTA